MSNSFAKCPKCGYGDNPVHSRTCEHCGAPLHSFNTTILIIISGLALLGAVGAGTFFLKAQPDIINLRQQPSDRPMADGTTQRSVNPDRLTGVGIGGGQLQGATVQTYRRYADIPNVPKGVFNYGGSTTFAPLRLPNIVQPIKATFPSLQLQYTEPTMGKPGSTEGIQMLIEGQLSFAQSSRGIKAQEFTQAKLKGYVLEEVPVAIDGIALYIHPEIVNKGLKGLTLAQVSDIFTGKVKNWKNVGGPDLKIIPISRNAQSGGTVDFFSENVLQKRPFGAVLREVRDTTEGLRIVATTPGAVGYATAAEIVGQRMIRAVSIAKNSDQNFISPCEDLACTTVNTQAFGDASYPIIRRLFVVIKRDQKLDEQAGVAYANLLLSDEGQASVRQAGFVPIR
jgi:phosphate transport system substrate-binding protein